MYFIQSIGLLICEAHLELCYGVWYNITREKYYTVQYHKEISTPILDQKICSAIAHERSIIICRAASSSKVVVSVVGDIVS